MKAGLFSGEERVALIESLEALLRPLLPVMLRYGVTLQDTQDVIRGLFIEELSSRTKAQGRPTTSARLGMFAGINRGEVEQLMVDRESREKLKQSKAQRVDEAITVLTTWHSDQQFTTPYGAPLDLSLTDEKGFKTFAQLVMVALPTLDPSIVLETMQATGCVEVHGGKFVRCASRSVNLGAEELAKIARLGFQGGNVIETLTHNLKVPVDGDMKMERRLESTCRVSEHFREEVEAYLRERSQSFLQECDSWMSEREQLFASADGKRVGLSLFYFEH